MGLQDFGKLLKKAYDFIIKVMQIKLYNILFERASNQAVVGFAKFLIERSLVPEKLIMLPRVPGFLDKADPQSNGKFPHYILLPKFWRQFTEKDLEEYKIFNPSDNNIIIKNVDDLNIAVKLLKIKIYPKVASKRYGSMSTTGTLTIFADEWQDPNQKFSKEQILNIIKSQKTQNILVHEFAHYADYLRIFFSKKSLSQYNKTVSNLSGYDDRKTLGIEYAESNMEIQARVADFVNTLNNSKSIKTEDEAADLWHFNTPIFNVLYALAKKDYKSFYTHALGEHEAFIAMKKSFKENKLSDKTFKRIVGNRLWKIFEEYKDKPEFQNLYKIFNTPSFEEMYKYKY